MESILVVVQGRMGLVAALHTATMQTTLTLLLVDRVRTALEVVAKTKPNTFGSGC